MSVEALAIVLHHSQAKGTAKVVLLGIANHDGDGGAWPAVSTLAKYANISREACRKVLARLAETGEVTRIINGGGNYETDEYLRPNLYRINVSCPPDCDRSKNHRTRRRPETPPLIGGPLWTEGGDPHGKTGEAPSVRRDKPSHQPTTSVIEKNSPNRARAKAACGHDLIDDRHCEYGCPTSIGATAS